jgi:peptide/nickel transport system substrate-binding protein
MDVRCRPGRISLFVLAISCLLLAECVPPQQYWNTAPPPPDVTPTPFAPTPVIPTNTPAAKPNTPLPTSAPVRVAGELRLAVREDVKTLNPYLAANTSEEFVASLLYDTLLDDDSRGSFRPNLAERWELAADGINLTFWLNPQARWHNGQPVTAEDVVFSFHLVRQKQFPGLVRIVALIDRGEAISPREVKFTLLTRRADAVRLLGTQLRIVPADPWQTVEDPLHYANWDNPVGSGPFLFVRRIEGEQLVFRNARTHHHMGSSVDALVVEILRNEDRALQALKDGELDALGWDVAPSVAHDVQDRPDTYVGIKLAEAPGLRTHTLLFNLRKAPYDNRAFRQALAHALNTQAVVDEVLMGFGDVATAGLIPAASPWRNTNIPPIAFDPQQAMEKLGAAGFLDRDGDGLRENPDGSALRIPIACTDLPTPLRVAELIAASWEAVGIAAEVSSMAQDLVMPALMEAQFDVILHNISLNEPEMAHFYFHTSRGVLNNGYVPGLNYGGYANPEYDDVATASQKELDPAKRQEMLHQLQEILAMDLPQIPLYHPRVLNLYRDDHFAGWSTEPGIGLLSRTSIANLTISMD